MIIPKHLKKIIKKITVTDKIKEIDLCCMCGSDKFCIYKNEIKKQKVSREDRDKIKKTIKWENEELFPLITTYGEAGPFNKVYYEDYPELKYRLIIIYNHSGLNRKFDLEKDSSRIIKKYKIKYGEVPLSIHEVNSIYKKDDTVIFKIKCNNCGDEYIIFDSRIHGQDSLDFCPNKLIEYKYKLITRISRRTIGDNVKVTIGYDVNEDLLKEESISSSQDVSNMFSYIKIQSIDDKKNKKTIYTLKIE